MLQDKYLNKLRELPEPVRQFGGLVTIIVIVILSFAILNIFWVPQIFCCKILS